MPTKKLKSKRKRPRGWSRAGPKLMKPVKGAAGALAEKETRSAKKRRNEFAVVGIGASAGGLSAFKKFLGAMPDRSGMAFVLIPHLDPKHQSLMAELLAKYTPMPICEAEDGMAVKAGHVYVLPPDKYLALRGGKRRLS